MSEDGIDVIVVGAGPAGAACALRLARAGRSVVLVERGLSAGAKNVSGGRLYTYALEAVEEGLTAQAPWERAVVREQIMLMDGKRAVTVTVADPPEPGSRPESATVLRAVLDPWLAGVAEDAGALLATGVVVDSLLIEHDRVVGIVADGEEMRAEVVVAADGVMSLLGRQAGLVSRPAAHAVGIGAKEVIGLESSRLEERFGVGAREGVAMLMAGCTGGTAGGGFLYTNGSSLSLGIVAAPAELSAAGLTVHRLLQDLKAHPALAGLLADAPTLEYSAHLVREDGWAGVPKRLTRAGFVLVGEAAGFVLNLGYTVRGMDLALLSGVAAAEAIIAGGDLETAYRSALDRTGLLATMRATRGYRDVLAMERMYAAYPALALDVAARMYAVDAGPPRHLRHHVTAAMRARGVPMRGVVRDALVGMRSL